MWWDNVDSFKRSLAASRLHHPFLIVIGLFLRADVISACESVAPVSAVVIQKEITDEELKVEAALQKLAEEMNIKLHSIWGLTLYHKSDIPYRISQIPDTYTQFRKAVETQSKIRDPLLMPERLRPIPQTQLEPGEVRLHPTTQITTGSRVLVRPSVRLPLFFEW